MAPVVEIRSKKDAIMQPVRALNLSNDSFAYTQPFTKKGEAGYHATMSCCCDAPFKCRKTMEQFYSELRVTNRG